MMVKEWYNHSGYCDASENNLGYLDLFITLMFIDDYWKFFVVNFGTIPDYAGHIISVRDLMFCLECITPD